MDSKTRFFAVSVLAVLLCIFFASSVSADITDLISGFLSPGDCSVKAFNDACIKCSFTPGGVIDEVCKNSTLDAGKACLFSTYPDAATKYTDHQCPAIDICINQLQTCISQRCPGTDKQDCLSAYCSMCYPEGDRCVARASVDCQGTAICSDKKCEADKGENSETCCTDCDGCKPGLVCESNSCLTPQEVETLTQGAQALTTSTLPQGTGILRALCLSDQNAFLLVTSMSVICGIPLIYKKKKF